MRYARTVEEVRKNAWAAQQLIHDEALFLPGWAVNYDRMGSWRWVRWPDTKDTPFSVPISYEPLEAYCLWIDDKVKAETHEAMKSGKTFPEVQKEVDDFKNGIPQQTIKIEASQKPDLEGDSTQNASGSQSQQGDQIDRDKIKAPRQNQEKGINHE